jgi:hypothetical protein
MKDLANKEIEAVKVELAKANFHIALFEWMAKTQEDKKKKAEILLKVESLKEGNKKNELYITMVEQFIKDLDGVPSPFPTK